MAKRADALLAVVDVETTPMRPGARPRTKFWGLAIEGKGYRSFERSADLVGFLDRYPMPLRVYHHHDYDPCQLIVDKITPQKIRMRGARIIRCEVAGTDWVNSFALFPDSLAKILDACGHKKLPLGCPVHAVCSKHPRGKIGCKDCLGASVDSCVDCAYALRLRNRSDCLDALDSFITLGSEYEQACGIDPVRGGYTTAASAAFAAAEIHAGKFPVDLNYHPAYRGGRTEAFRVGDCGVSDSFDINSSYPAAFVDLPNHDYLWHARVKISPEDAPRPFFAECERSEGLKFPAGRFDTWFFGDTYERYYAPHSGILEVKEIERVRVSLTWVKRVAPMVATLYQKRVESEHRPALKYALKIFLNSLYGRMGMKPGRKDIYRSPTAPDSGTAFRVGPSDYLCFRSSFLRPKANYALAAAVTDNARGRLYDAMRRTGDVWYCDTDSIYCAPGRSPGDLDPVRLGAWKQTETGPMKIRTVKDYEFAGKEVRKGGGKQKQWTIRLALGGKGVQQIDRQRRTDYDKRRVRRDGSTAPLIY